MLSTHMRPPVGFDDAVGDIQLVRPLERETYTTMFPIVESVYHSRGGANPRLSGTVTVSTGGRADIRLPSMRQESFTF